VTNEANSHRHISNLFDVKLRAIENLHAAGIRITPVVTLVNTVNERGVGPIVDFCMENFDKIGGPAFQPVSFTGRDEEISDADRARQRYTTSHLAHELRSYYDGKIDPLRDWFPLSVGTSFAALTDHLRSPEEPFGQVSCSCHPNCGAAVMLVANRRTKAWAPVTSFFDLDQFLKDVNVIIDSGRGRTLSLTQIGLSFLRNFDQRKAPPGLTRERLLALFDKKLNGALSGRANTARRDWRLMWIASMWFQDLWTYDFRRTEMCVIPYATQEGEISFCAYNTGVGWRQIVENMHMVATTRDWFKSHGRHPIYAGNRPVPLPDRRELPVLSAGAANGAGAVHAAGRCACH